MKSTKHSILTSALTMLVCLCMFVGSTFAWFSDSVTSSNNIIQSGTLDLEMYWTDNLDTGTWYNVEDAATNTVFSYDNWEPGYTDVRYIKIKNVGNLALNYQLAIEPQGKVGKLAEVINVYFANEGINIQTREDLNQLGTLGFLNHVMNGGATASGTLLPASQQSPLHDSGEIIVTMAMSMITSAGNEYQDETIGDGFTIKALATQASYEKDSFDELYDNDAELPESLKGDSASGAVTSENGVVTQPLTLKGKGVTAYVPAGVLLEDGVTQLELTVTPLKSTTSDITVVNNEVLIPVDVHIEGISQNNTTPIIIDLGEVLPKYLNMGNYHLYHVEGNNNNEMALVDTKEELNAHNQYTYDLNTGAVTLAMATFSEVALVADTANGWKGEYDYSWYTNVLSEEQTETSIYTISNADQLAAFGAIVGGMNGQTKNPFAGQTVKLISDINLGDGEASNNSNVIFYPIGYYNNTENGSYGKTSGGSVTSSVSSFEGTFDGNGHTISNFYQNTWEMFGDYNDGYSGTPNHYKDAMGLFGYVLNGTVKNLTVNNFSSDGEYTPTGVIAAYADGKSTFENIAITNCNPRVYNTGNGGIIGIAGDTSAKNDDHITLKNITVDNSNKISALWGSWDVACGGLVGMYRGNVDGSGNATGDTISFENCHVSAQIDVYNDVCANYQYYAYRYSGMIIGSVRHNTKNAEGKTIPNMTGISATGCTVNYGDWNDYYYCEFEKNSLASYSEDYQFSRVDKSEIVFDENGEVVGCTHTHTDAEDKRAVYLPFHQLFTGYSWGVSSIGLKEYSGIVTNLDITEGEQEKSDVKFETKFTGDFLYRVGNQNTVSIGSLFAAKKGATINNSGVVASVEKLDKNMNVSGTFTANDTDWTKGTIQFSGTGVVKVTIQDYNFCIPTVLMLEVVDAKNIIKAESATSNNVVLLNNISGTFTVSNGKTFYGNGFEITLPTNSVQNVGNGFTGYISIGATQDDGIASGGHLDNVRILGPVYPEMYIYRDQAKITNSSDSDYGDGNNMRYFKNSVIVYGGNVTISNSYISGSRTALCLRGGNNVVVENTTLSGGAYANMQICSGSKVILRNLTTVQKDENDSYGKEKIAHGLGVAVDSDVVDIDIEGELNQYNWLNKAKWDSIVPSAYQNYFPKFFSNQEFEKHWHYLEGEDKPYVNLAFVFACNWNKDRIHDKRNEDNYGATDATINSVSGGIYSNINENDNTITKENIDAVVQNVGGYNPVAPILNFDNSTNEDPDDSNDANDTYCVYNTSNRTLNIGITGNEKSLDLSKVSISKNGIPLEYTVYLNDKEVSGNSVTISASDGAKQVLMFKASSKDAGFDKNGNPIQGRIEYTWTINIDVAVLSYPIPEWNMGGNYQFDKTNLYYVYFNTSQGYGEAVPIYEGIKLKYYNKEGKNIELDLSGTTTIPTESNKNNSSVFTYKLSDGSTLMMKFVSGWKSGATTHLFTTYQNKVYMYPQSLDNDNYVRSKVTNQDFDVKITYTFTDPNGQSITQTMRWYNAKSNNSSVKTVQWKKFDSTNGRESNSCITPDTLITLADGTKKRVDSLAYEDEILVWDFFKGDYTTKNISILVNHGKALYDVVYTKYSDGSLLKLIGEHGVFDYDLNKFVYITSDNIKDYIGHRFVKQDENGTYKIVIMTEGYVRQEYEEAWSISSEVTSNAFASGLLTVAPPEDFYNWIEMNGKLHYDVYKFYKDVAEYGLYSYDVFKDYVTYEQFLAWNGAYLKIPVEKGYFDFEYILELIDLYKQWMK